MTQDGRGDGVTAGEELLALTLGAAERDAQTVTTQGRPVEGPLDGVVVHRSTTIVDDRGTLMELFDPRWGWHPLPLVSAYLTTIRPGHLKGWALHKEHEDRYAHVQGELEVVLYDVRPGSGTCGRVSRIVFSQYDRGQVNIPAFVWHGLRNLGGTDVLVVNFPTVPFDHANPDKYRLPIDTPHIPASLTGPAGW